MDEKEANILFENVLGGGHHNSMVGNSEASYTLKGGMWSMT
jgi:hypothetical protein